MNKPIDTEWLNKAVSTVTDGIADKLSKDNILVYRVKDVIRIDIKTSK